MVVGSPPILSICLAICFGVSHWDVTSQWHREDMHPVREFQLGTQQFYTCALHLQVYSLCRVDFCLLFAPEWMAFSHFKSAKCGCREIVDNGPVAYVTQ